MAAEPGHRARRRHPRDEPGAWFGGQHGVAGRGAALPHADRGDQTRAERTGAGRTRADLIAAVGEYERQMRDYGYAAVAASRQAEAETGARRHPLLFWLYRRRARS